MGLIMFTRILAIRGAEAKDCFCHSRGEKKMSGTIPQRVACSLVRRSSLVSRRSRAVIFLACDIRFTRYLFHPRHKPPAIRHSLFSPPPHLTRHSHKTSGVIRCPMPTRDRKGKGTPYLASSAASTKVTHLRSALPIGGTEL